VARATAECAVVLVNVSALRSDALIIRDGSLQVVPLPDLDPEGLAEVAQKLEDQVDAWKKTAQEPVDDGVLKWLWRVVVGPVVDWLAAVGHTETELPHVVWIPTGRLSLLPLHAAASSADGEGALDCIVSSYAPNLRSLLWHRWQRTDATTASPRPFVVAVSHDAELGALPAAMDEALSITRLYAGATLATGDDATLEAVCRAMESRDVIHFACHGVADLAEPRRSHLSLRGGDALTVDELLNRRPRRAQLAFLSACDTTRTSPMLVEEAVHLTAAFYVAGFPRVVGTLWSLPDKVAERVGVDVHRVVARDGARSAARALNEACRRLRSDHPAQWLCWASHIHYGA
jgi:CHAT domain-containing protein